MKAGLLATIAVAATSLALSAQAGTPALAYDQNSGSQLGNGPFTLGWEFTTSKAFKVDGLGVFDDSLDGLQESHDVGLWDGSGNLLASTTVGSGTAGTLIDNFRYSSVSPVTIAAGTYYVGAVWNSLLDPMVFPGAGGNVTTLPGVNFVQDAYVAGGSLSFPFQTTGEGASYFGANATLGGVPEPATWALMLMGFAGLGAALRSRRAALRVA